MSECLYYDKGGCNAPGVVKGSRCSQMGMPCYCHWHWRARADAAEKDAGRLAVAIPHLCPGWCEYGVKHGATSYEDCSNAECPIQKALCYHEALKEGK